MSSTQSILFKVIANTHIYYYTEKMEQYSAKGIKELIDKHGFTFSKSMGQNFLIDANIPAKIVKMSGIDSSCGVIEIGPGLGAMTAALSNEAGRVVAVELDRRLLPVLEDAFAGRDNTEIIQGDILKMDIAGLANEKIPGMKRHACSNLPYSITTPAITALVGSGVFDKITVMVQREVARRICALPGSPDYGAFAVYVNYHHSERKILFDVPPECFLPRPKVYSSVVTMEARAERLLDSDKEQVFFRVVRAAFNQRRKTLVNALYASFGNTMGKRAIADAVSSCGFDLNARGETLGVPEFIKLAECFL